MTQNKKPRNHVMKEAFTKAGVQKTLPNPSNDGVTHINIHHLGKTFMGRFLGGGDINFDIKELGGFSCLTAFMLYVHKPEEGEEFRYLPAYKANQLQRRIMNKVAVDAYYEYIKDARRSIINSNGRTLKDLVSSDLPFECYYLRKTGVGNMVIPVATPSAEITIRMMNELRDEFRNKEEAVRPDYRPIVERVTSLMEAVVETEPNTLNVKLDKNDPDPIGTIDKAVKAVREEVSPGKLYYTADDELVVDKEVIDAIIDDVVNESGIPVDVMPPELDDMKINDEFQPGDVEGELGPDVKSVD